MRKTILSITRALGATNRSGRPVQAKSKRRAALGVEQLEERCTPATFSTTYMVNSLADVDPGGTSTSGTLRHVIDLANTNATGTAAAPDLIQFSVSGTIDVNSADGGPLALAAGEVAVIDGTSAPGYLGTPLIILDGTSAGAGVAGLTISGGSSTVKGLDIVHFSGDGLRLDTNGGDTVLGNFIGISAAGLAAANGGNGISINGTANNTIGGTAAGDANVVSGNTANGILITGAGASNNVVLANLIGTNAAGSAAVGNGGNGIELTLGAHQNTIGGNTPTATAFTGKPVDGNVISASGGDGVLINAAATLNTLSGNFIGTDLTGLIALGNALNGVEIVNADNNSLSGTTLTQNPFVFLNLICANGENGLLINNSNNTTVQANSFGLADDNSSPLGNELDGVLIEGSSANTQFGGVIPLGNISAGNGGNGVEIAGTASGTVAFNTFDGLPAFVVKAVGNALDGMLITSTGGNNTLRTNVIAGNAGNGVHISGDASGVTVEQDIIGMDTNGQTGLPNGGDGILIDGTAHDNNIGGLAVSVIPQNLISSNGGDGIEITGNAHDNQVFHSFIGTNVLGVLPFGNSGDGIFIGGSASDTTIGGTGVFDQNIISANGGDGIDLGGASQATTVIGNLIGTQRDAQSALGNQGDGVDITTSGNQIGAEQAGAGNVIAFNSQNGVEINAALRDGVSGNSIFGNAGPGILLANGGNANQPAPILTQASEPAAGIIHVAGVLNAAANTTYTIEVFASVSGSPGQGQNYLGAVTTTTGADGFAAFDLNSALPASAGGFITATATDPANNTSMFSSPITVSGNANSVFVANIYELLLKRAPDAGAGGWIAALNHGASPVSVVLAIEHSPEYVTDEVAAIYARYLHRGLDPASHGWISLLLDGGTVEEVAEGVVGSPEFFQDQGGTNQGFVLALYQDVLNRTPSTAELNSWLTNLNDGFSLQQVAVGFITSNEYRTDLVESYYTLYLGRPADPISLIYWVGKLQGGETDQQVIASFLGSPEGILHWS